jgi:hydrogenase expression/formation protein HypE
MAHGGGGKLMHQLIETMIRPTLGAGEQPAHDAALLSLSGKRLAFTTDSYVVKPIFFPGGDIGSLAVHGTVNDLAMAGATPQFLSLGLILEEGLPMEILWRVLQSIRTAADRAGVRVVTGDTKVVDRGKGDGIFINTAGVGVLNHDHTIAPQCVQPGDLILVNGDLGRHGIAIMAVREGLEFETTIISDSAPVAEPVLALLEAGIEVHCLRDLTRGGLVSALNEIAEAAGVAIAINETDIPINEQVQGACEILGLDPLYIANEGRFVAFVPPDQAEQALAILCDHQTQSCVIGQVNAKPHKNFVPTVTLRSRIGADRILEMISGEQLPRIC